MLSVDSTCSSSTLVELLRHRADTRPDGWAYTFLGDAEGEETRLTYGELDARARGIAARLQAGGARDRCVLLLYPPGLEFIAAYFGCLYAGAVAVPAYPPRQNRSLGRLQAIAADARAAAVLTTSGMLASLAAHRESLPGAGAMAWIATDEVPAELAAEWADPGVTEDTLAFLQYSSGSTSTPKGVRVTHRNLLYNERMIREAFGHTPEWVERGLTIMGWLPFYHDMGLIGNVLHPLYLGAPCVLMSPVSFLKRPVRWLETISRFGAHTSGGPNFAYDLCVQRTTPEERAGLDLGTWTLAFNGAEPISSATLDRFAEAFAPAGFRREAFFPCYGLAEATLIVTGSRKSAPPTIRSFDPDALARDRAVEAEGGRPLVGCGRTLLEQRIAVARPDTLGECAEGEVGEILVSGPHVADGYWNAPEATAETFGAYLAGSGEGPFLRTGDLGFVRDGELFVTGRLKDLVIVRGRNYYPHDLERTAEAAHPALHAGCSAAFALPAEGDAAAERLVLVMELRREALHRLDEARVAEVVDAVRRAVSEEHELQCHAVVLVRPLSVPKTSSGKIQRYACRNGFLEGTLNEVGRSVLAAPDGEAEGAAEPVLDRAALLCAPPEERVGLLEGFLRAAAARVLRVPAAELEPDRPMGALGLDSLGAVELRHVIESRLEVRLDDAFLLEGPTLAGIAREVAARLDDEAAEPLPAAPAGSTHPLSHGQRALWFLNRLDPGSAAYNLGRALRLRGEVDLPALRRAWDALAERHPALRTAYSAEGGDPVQTILPAAGADFAAVDASAWSEAELGERLAEEADRPFDLGEGRPLRVRVFSRSADEAVMLVAVHHVAVDFWSLEVVLDELRTLYAAERAGAPAALPEPRARYTDFVHREAARVREGAEDEAYWVGELAGAPEVLELSPAPFRPPVQAHRGASHTFHVPAELADRLAAVGRERGATRFAVLLAAFQALLHRYTGQEEVLVGTPAANRVHADLADVVGYFVNPVVLRGRFDAETTCEQGIARARDAVVGALTHQGFPFPLLVERLGVERDPSRSPLFQAMFVLHRAVRLGDAASFLLGEEGASMDFGGLRAGSLPLPRRAAQFDLTLAMAETADGLLASVEYDADLFEAEWVERFGERLVRVLEAFASAPEQPVGAVALLAPEERRHLLERVAQDGPAPELSHALLHRFFEAQARRTPAATALVCGGRTLSYSELDVLAE
ncbi:MAG TPA: condensation domain-containing protein, partial [Longimicrobiaceae bacterium]|nr:condensation domain-containing protein [Longimicrobiaceae bacterium]